VRRAFASGCLHPLDVCIHNRGWAGRNSNTVQVGQATDFELNSRQYLVIQDHDQSGLGITGDLTLVGWVVST